ncbi:MAG: ABC transporter ATP-binding protein [Pseudomonadales bacterium]
MKGENVVRTLALTRDYGDGAQRVRALDSVDFTVDKGEFVSLAGPSGSGKSTLLNLIGGLDTPTSGEVWVGDDCLTAKSAAELAHIRLHRIGFVFQAYNLLPVLSARENVEFVMQLQGVDATERRERADRMLDAVGLAALADRRPGDMSGGQQQRVAVARALVTEPLLLLADEPSANLDSETTESLLGLLRAMNERFATTIITATHDPIVMRYARRHIQLKDGRIVADDVGRPPV